jgi:hypothetical protein
METPFKNKEDEDLFKSTVDFRTIPEHEQHQIRLETYVGHWSINYTPDEPDQFCLWKRKKPKLINRIFNWYLLGNKWIDSK